LPEQRALPGKTALQMACAVAVAVASPSAVDLYTSQKKPPDALIRVRVRVRIRVRVRVRVRVKLGLGVVRSRVELGLEVATRRLVLHGRCDQRERLRREGQLVALVVRRVGVRGRAELVPA
jgi:hypothetical protein